MTMCHDCGGQADWRGWARHHIKPKGMGGSKINKETVLLCSPCHSLRHNIKEVQSEPQWTGDNRRVRE